MRQLCAIVERKVKEKQKKREKGKEMQGGLSQKPPAFNLISPIKFLALQI
jgi:hypothetical protein